MIPFLEFLLTRCRKFDPELEATPYRTIEEFWMARGADDDAIGRDSIHVEEQGAHDALDFAGLVRIRSFLCHGFELVEEEQARHMRDVVDDLLEPRAGLAEIAAHHAVVSNRKERKTEFCCQSRRETGLSGSRRADEQDRMPRLQRMGPQQRGLTRLFDEFLKHHAVFGAEDDVFEAPGGNALVEQRLQRFRQHG
jgi:hypothetical protein